MPLQKKTLKGNFQASKQAEREFQRALKKVARASGHIVEAHVDGITIKDQQKMTKSLEAYAELLGPWAERQATNMINLVKKSNQKAYKQKAKALSTELKKQFLVGKHMTAEALISYDLHREQVALIKSIPIEAGLRAQELARKGVLAGQRAMPDQSTIEEIKKELGLSTEVATSRAVLIARTETAKANATINQARAMSAGSNQYRWHNSGDSAVRPSHKTYKGRPLQGMIFSWDNPPTLSDGMTGHPGEFPNCRCFAEPIFPEE
jgi:SPP1 gp7 family putative phage head morphogenesis protein